MSLFGGEFRGGRAEAAPQLCKDPTIAGMVEVLYSSPEPSTGPSADMRMLPHLMTLEEMNDLSSVVRIDESENQWNKESGQLDVRPADELADPGPRGKFEPTPAISAEFALDFSRALTVDTEYGVGFGDRAQGIGEAQGVGDPPAQGDDINDAIFSVTSDVIFVIGAFFCQ